MQFFTTLLAAAAVLASAVDAQANTGINKWPGIKQMSGFNLGANRPDGKCKTVNDWTADFQKIKQWGALNTAHPKARFGAVKLFSTFDCDALNLAVQAAAKTNMKVWAGIWGSDDAKFNREKAALERVLKTANKKYLVGVNVGSEALYRGEISPQRLASQIYDVKGMIQQAYKLNIPVGSADTWTMWVRGDTRPVIQACDIVLMNGFPYWQGENVGTKGQAVMKLREAIYATRKAIGSGKAFMIGETGWPTQGKDFVLKENPAKVAKASLANLKTYWEDTMCWLQARDFPYFWFSGFDEPNREIGEYNVERYFGIAYSGRTPKVNMKIASLNCKKGAWQQ